MGIWARASLTTVTCTLGSLRAGIAVGRGDDNVDDKTIAVESNKKNVTNNHDQTAHGRVREEEDGGDNG